MTKSDDVETRHTRHSRADVVEAALAILDQHGLPDLTMRRLAATLDVQPSALYWHFANKQTLLASIADQIVSRAVPREVSDGGWSGAVRAEAEALRDALLAFRDGAEVVSSTLALGLGAGEPQTSLATAIRGGGFDRQTSEVAAAALLHFVLGHVSHEQQRLQADSLGVVAAGHSADPATAIGGRAAFDFGITLLLTGLESQAPARLLGDSAR
ncbi:TetR/AcrR family transcriptional regulator C-terminal domain-containing protein [Lacisediminihabitans sp.]|uniref:TetR/AcrR family transcriptional regulator C-terminal domain-containing protein n=1 Tax=Lacisediminihabitans sp. TaxID=2787631 RepID=UPI00374C8C9C